MTVIGESFKSWRRHFVAVATLSLLGSVPVHAQDGPPKYVRDAVDQTLELLRSDDDDAATQYVDSVMTGIDQTMRYYQIAQILDIRNAVANMDERIDVEARPGGVALLFSGGAARQTIHLDITPTGVTRIELADSTESLPLPASDRDGRVEQHLFALETVHRLDWNEFVSNHFSKSYLNSIGPADLSRMRVQLVGAAAQAEGAGIDITNEGFRLTLEGPDGRLAITFTVEDNRPFGIDTIRVEDANANLSLPEISRINFDRVLAMAEEAGLDGIVYVKVNGTEIARTPLGFSDRERKRPMTTDMVFGVGSQPIDYTTTLAWIAAAQGKLELDAPVSRYVGKVPSDKQDLRVRHLLENTSGLPDFLDNESDWDPDLSWITRDELVRRVLKAPLRFQPGARRGHSHAGFTFLAAVIEIAVEKPYFDYLEEQILRPAGMTHSKLYGDSMGLDVDAFAVGGGPNHVGLPNIPPNWGPTSWLVMGSGGMVSTLDDILRFTRFVQTSETLPPEVRAEFTGEATNLNGSMRGYEMFEYRRGTDTLILLFSNSPIGDKTFRDLATRLEQFGASLRSHE